MSAKQTRTCEGCRWFRPCNVSEETTYCDNEGSALFAFARNERNYGNCGPAGRYWEQREKGDE